MAVASASDVANELEPAGPGSPCGPAGPAGPVAPITAVLPFEKFSHCNELVGGGVTVVEK